MNVTNLTNVTNVTNAGIVNALKELSQLADALGETYKSKAYRNAALALEKVTFKITPANVSDVKNVLNSASGGIFKKIKEFVDTGSIAELIEARKSRELSKIIGVGPATIKKWRAAGVDSLAALRRAVGENKISLNNMQKWGLRYYDDLNTRIPRDEVSALGNLVRCIMLRHDPGTLFEIAGSYRRNLPDSGDVDIIASNKLAFNAKLLPATLKLLSGDRNFVDALSAGSERVTFLYRSPVSAKVRQIDILNVPYNSYYAALLYFTGDYAFNEQMRGWAKGRGLRLNQNGVFKVSGDDLRLIPTDSEEEIFKILGLQYIRPEGRSAAKVIPLAG